MLGPKRSLKEVTYTLVASRNPVSTSKQGVVTKGVSPSLGASDSMVKTSNWSISHGFLTRYTCAKRRYYNLKSYEIGFQVRRNLPIPIAAATHCFPPKDAPPIPYLR